MKILIYGAGNNGRAALRLLSVPYGLGSEISAVLDREKTGNLEGYPILPLNKTDVRKSRVVIAINDFHQATGIWRLLSKAGCQDIWWFPSVELVHGRDFFEEQCVSCEAWADDMLNHVEMHIMDACNLNCRGCTHFSPIFDRTLPDFDTRIRDVRLIKSKVSHIVHFYILGGEPFLNPEIGRYAAEIRSILPQTELVIVTNGLLLSQVQDSLLLDLKQNRVKISITEYSPVRRQIGEIRSRLDRLEIIYQLRQWEGHAKFNLPLTTRQNSVRPHLCISDGCVNIWNGKLSRCPTLMYIDRFNQYFGTNLPNQGIYNLEDAPDGAVLLQELSKTVPLCSYCIKNEIDWEPCRLPARLEDFAAAD